MSPRWSPVAAALLALAASDASPAATVRADDPAYTRFEAAAGEANQVSSRPQDGGHVLISDVGAPLTPGAGCTAVSGSEASCGIRDGGLAADLGDGDDTADFAASLVGVILDGGDGDDALQGSGQADIVDGGAGADTIRSLGGDDTVRGAPGDLIFAGDGSDLVNTGDARAAGPESQIDCGAGADTVWTLRADVIGRNCERWVTDAISLRTAGTLTRRALVFRARCNAGGLDPGAGCSGRLRLRREDGTTIGTVRYANRNRPGFSVAFPLRAADRRLIREGRTLALEEIGGPFGFRMLQRG